jgi:hypothetical protein
MVGEDRSATRSNHKIAGDTKLIRGVYEIDKILFIGLSCQKKPADWLGVRGVCLVCRFVYFLKYFLFKYIFLNINLK